MSSSTGDGSNSSISSSISISDRSSISGTSKYIFLP